MNTTKPMSAANLVQCLAGEMLVDTHLMIETIKEDINLLRVVKSYGLGDLTYEQVLDTIKDYF